MVNKIQDLDSLELGYSETKNTGSCSQEMNTTKSNSNLKIAAIKGKVKPVDIKFCVIYWS